MAVLSSLKGSKLAKNILPSLPPLNRRPVWHEPELQYDGREPPKAWLARLRQLKQIHGYSEKETLKIAKKCLKGDAKLWFRIHQPQSFSSMRTGLHTRFSPGPVATVVKPSLPAPQSQDLVVDFLSDVPMSLSSEFVIPSSLSKGYKSPSKRSFGDRSACASRPFKNSSGGRSVYARSLIRPKSVKIEMFVSTRSLSPVNLLDRKSSSVSQKSATGVVRSSVSSTLSDVNTCKGEDVSCELNVKHPVGPNQNKLVRSHHNSEEKQGLVVPGSKVGFVKPTNVGSGASEKISVSSRKELGCDTVSGGLLNQTSRSKDTVGDSSLHKSVDTFSLSSMNHSISAKEVMEGEERNTLPRSCKDLPTNWQQTLLQFKHAIHSAMKADWKYMSADFCKFYLQCYGMRTSGSRNEQIHRIRDHLELTDGSGTQKYPRKSFLIDCTGDVCLGDVIFFEQRMRQGYDVLSGNLYDNVRRKTVGRVVKDFRSPASEQLFTIEVYWSKGPHAFRLMRPVCIRAVDLYRLKPSRQMWINEEARKQMLEEKKSLKLRKQVPHIP